MTPHIIEIPTSDAPKSLSSSRKSAEKRDTIIRAAIEIINAKSYALATMTEIAASVNLRDAALYYYFQSKQALVYACHIHSLERFEGLIDGSNRFDGNGASQLRHFIHALLEESNVNGPQLYFGDRSYLKENQRQIVDLWADRLVGRLQVMLEHGIADGSIMPCETRLVVQLLLGMIIWLAKWVPTIDGLTPERLMQAIGAISFSGLEIVKR